MDPTTGQIKSVPNPSYQPTDPARIAAQLQQQAQAQRDTLNQQVPVRHAQRFGRGQPVRSVVAGERRAPTGRDPAGPAGASPRPGHIWPERRPEPDGDDAVPGRPRLRQSHEKLGSAFATHQFPGNIDLGSAVTFQLPTLQQTAQQGCGPGTAGRESRSACPAGPAAAHDAYGQPGRRHHRLEPVQITPSVPAPYSRPSLLSASPRRPRRLCPQLHLHRWTHRCCSSSNS